MQQSSAAALRLEPHPREVPALLRFRLRFEPLFFGAVILFVVSLACSYAITQCDLTNHQDDIPIGRGEITAVEDVLHSKSKAVVGHVVTARYAGGPVTSHFTGNGNPRVGATVEIRGDGDPRHVVIAGGKLRSGKLGFPLYLVVAGVAIFTGAFLLQMVRSHRQLRLLREGREGVATFLFEKARRKQGPALVYEFFDGHTTRELINASPGEHDRDRTEPILFDHASAVFLDALPGRLRAEGGRFVAAEPATRAAGAFVLLVVPLVVAMAAGAFWLAGVTSEADLVRAVQPRNW